MTLRVSSAGSLGRDDYALERVPQEARHSWWSAAAQRIGQISNLSQFLLGATLGFGMTFWDAFLAVTLGIVILEVVTLFTGVMGQREGLSMSVLARWSGFGQGGSALIGLAIAVSLIGWFGIQCALSAEGLVKLIGVLPVWAWSLMFGAIVTVIVVYGFGSMAWTAYITVPAMLLLAGWSIISELSRHSFGDLVASAPAGPVLSLAEGTALVAGSFIVGSVITPDMTRFNRTTADVVKQTVLGITLGEYGVCLIGVLLAHAVRTADIVSIVTSTSGTVGVLVIIAATLKINDWNLYSASLGIVNFAHTAFGRRLNRVTVTVVIGALGSVVAAAGVLHRFIDFLTLLGVVFPPVAGIMVAEYFIVRAFAGALDTDSDRSSEPATCPRWVPATLVVWLIASVVGKYVTWGLGTINALVVAFVLYVALGKLGLLRPVGGHGARDDEARLGSMMTTP